MKTYLKLVHLEIQRFQYVLLGMILVSAGIQLFGAQIAIRTKMDEMYLSLKSNGWTMSDYLHMRGNYPFEKLVNSGYTFLPIAGTVTIILFYAVFIWYRDWFGRSSFIYRLLMLPHARFSIYLAKFTAMLVFIMSMIASQVVILMIDLQMYKAGIIEELRSPALWRDGARLSNLNVLMFPDFTSLALQYSIGAVFLLLVFTIVLLERSYRWKGLVVGVIYVAAMAILMLRILFFARAGVLLLPSEWLLITILLAAANALLALLLGRRLIQSKIAI